MKKFFHYSLLGTIILMGTIFLLGKFHFLLGSLLCISQIPLMLIGSLVLWRRKPKGFQIIHKALLLIVCLLLVNWSYENIRRINFSSTDTQQEVSILSYNLFFKNNYPQQIIQEILQTDPDILVVQELTNTWNEKLKSKVYNRYKYQKTFVNKGTHGLGILSKYPIQSCEYLKNSSGLPVNQICQVKVGNKDLILVNTHLSSPAIAVENPKHFFKYYKANVQKRTLQWESLNQYLNEKYPEKPQLIAGDLNTMKIEPLYHQMRHQWKDLHSKKGKGRSWNFPNVASVPRPFLTLDYILYRGNIKGRESKVLKGSSSDHLAVLGKIEL